MKVENERPSSFFVSGPVKIRDEKKNFFYFHPNPKGKLLFNLPKGRFYTDVPLTRETFKPYPTFVLPLPDHYFGHEGMKVYLGTNPCKATITPKERVIKVDEKLSTVEYRPAKVFFMGHEYGHLRFIDENICDLFACNFMLLNGYNPTQIKTSYEMLFSKNPGRRTFLNEKFDEQNFLRHGQ